MTDLQKALDHAAELLAAGEVVGLPTETVYGLAARLDRPEGLKKIFQIKERPFFDPLIVHVNSIVQAQSLCTEWTPLCQILAESFWPGPLTLVVPKSRSVPDLVTSGLESVGLRCPDHPLAQELIARSGPLAAPSANRFGRTSPTTWHHVREEFGDQVFVLKSEDCQIGIESTILKVDKQKLALLRPGMITPAQIEAVLHRQGLKFEWSASLPAREAPGQMKHHYMPRIPLVWVPGSKSLSEIESELNARRDEIPSAVEGVALPWAGKGRPLFREGKELLLPLDPALAARRLYAELRELGQSNADYLYFRFRPEMKSEAWNAVLERLSKAASLRLT